MKNFIQIKLRGAVEFMLFMPKAEERFRGTTFKAMLYSCLIPILLLPYGIWGMTLTHGTELQGLAKLEGINNFSTTVFIFVSLLKGVLITAFMIFVIYMFAKWMDRKEFFFDYLAAGNWVLIPGMVPSLIVFVMVFNADPEWMSVYMVATLHILYGLAVSAFMTTRLLNIPWELGTAVAIFGLAIGETANKIVNLVGLNYFG